MFFCMYLLFLILFFTSHLYLHHYPLSSLPSLFLSPLICLLSVSHACTISLYSYLLSLVTHTQTHTHAHTLLYIERFPQQQGLHSYGAPIGRRHVQSQKQSKGNYDRGQKKCGYLGIQHTQIYFINTTYNQ